MPTNLLHFPSARCNECHSLNAESERRFPRSLHADPGPPIPWPVAPFVALGMAAAMLPWLPLAYLMHINRPE